MDAAVSDELQLSSLEVDESLEGRLQAHGLSRRNVKSMIHSIFTDENVLRLLEGSEERPELDIPLGPVTRSKKCNAIFNDSYDSDISDLINYHDADGKLCDLSSAPDENTIASSVWTDCNETARTTLNTGDNAYIDENGDFNMKNWLDDLHDEVTTSNAKTNDVSDSDSDYHFLEETEERDEEDYRYDRTTRISKKELKSLRKKRKVRQQAATGKNGLPNHPAFTSINTVNGITKAQAVDAFLKFTTAHDKLNLLRNTSKLSIPPKQQKLEVKIEYFTFSEKQLNDLKHQMQQHVQLLAQLHFLDNNASEKANANCLLQEIEYFKTASCVPMRSAFNVANIDKAIELTTLERNNSTNSEVLSIARCIAESPVFMYRELLPQNLDMDQQNGRKTRISYHEDCLIAHGCYEMSSHFVSTVDLTQQLLLPGRSASEIRNRIKAVMHGRLKGFASNPIFKFKMSGILPQPCKLVCPVMCGDITKPIDMRGNLPNWLRQIKNSCGNNNRVCNKTDFASVHCKKSARNLQRSKHGKAFVFWTKEMDKTILLEVQRNSGLTKRALSAIHSSLPTRNHKQIRRRFQKLMKMYNGSDSDES